MQVTRVAGNGFAGFVDGPSGPDFAAEFKWPLSLTFDAQGTLYVVDEVNNRIRKIDASGRVTTVAGQFILASIDGTGGPHGTAAFSYPSSMAIDAQHNLFVADRYGNSIRKIDAANNVTTFAGNGHAGRVDGTGGHSGSAEFSSPGGLAFDSAGNLFVADTGNHCIRKVDAQGNVTTLAGDGTMAFADGQGAAARFNGPTSLVVDAHGTLFVSDSGNNRIRKVDAQGNVTTLAGPTQFTRPGQIAFDPQGNLLVSDTSGNAIRKVATDGTVSTLIDFLASFDTFQSNNPGGLAVDAQGNLYVSALPYLIQIDPTGTQFKVIGGQGSGFADGLIAPDGTAEFNSPIAIAIDGTGTLLVSDTGNNRIRKVDAHGNVTTFVGNGTEGLVDGPGGTAEFFGPSGLALDTLGNLFVADSDNHCIRKVDAQGNVSTFAGRPTPGFADRQGAAASFARPTGLAFDTAGNLYVGDFGNHSVRRIDAQGNVTTLAGNGTQGDVPGTGGRSGTAEFDGPGSLAVDAQGNVFVADIFTRKLSRIDPQGNVSLLVDFLQFGGRPNGLVLDALGDLCVSDDQGSAVGVYSLSTFTFLAGSYVGYVDGPGGPGGASLNAPNGIALDAQGNLFIADTGNYCIRKLTR